MHFCETNRIGFDEKTGAKCLLGNWIRSMREKISIRFVWNDVTFCWHLLLAGRND